MIAIYKADLQIAIAKKKQRGWIQGAREGAGAKKESYDRKRKARTVHIQRKRRPPSQRIEKREADWHRSCYLMLL